MLVASDTDRPRFLELVEAIRDATGSHARVVHIPGCAIPGLVAILGRVLGDMVLTPDKYRAMTDGLADTDSPTVGETSVLDWIAAHGEKLGNSYANELDRHFR